jgi:pyruvate kinase
VAAGVLVDLPVLGPKDVEDVQQFAAKHKMDYIFASFVQSADDVLFIRKVGKERQELQEDDVMKAG